MKSTTVRGTPVRSISGTNEGQMAGKPAGYDGTVNTQYRGDQTSGGTPYNSKNGNPPGAKRVASHGKFGDVIDTQTGVNLNEPQSNGNGVVFDGIGEGQDYTPWLGVGSGVHDSPVPTSAQMPVKSGANTLNAIRNGSGAQYAGDKQIPDQILRAGGVMSRGMLGTSTPSGAETELTEDDALQNQGSGGAY